VRPPSEPPLASGHPSELGATTDDRAGSAILNSVRAHPLLVVVVTIVTALAGLIWSAARSRSYEASAQVLLTPLSEGGRSLARIPLLVASSDRTRLAQTAANLLDSPAAAAETARAMGDGWTAERVAASVDVEPEGESDVLSLTATAHDPTLAARLANEFARAALEARDEKIRDIVVPLTTETERELSAVSDPSSPVALDLAERLGDLRSIGTTGDPTLSLSRRAQASAAPLGPSGKLIFLLSLLGGLAVGIGSALVIDTLGPRRIADDDDAVAATALPVLARVPALSLLQRATASPVTFRPAAASALRMLQHQLELESTTRRCIMFAGVSPRDGVTTTVAELGLTLARAGHMVLLVDIDAREPKLASRLGAYEPPPLSDALGSGNEFVAVPHVSHLQLAAVGRHGSMGIPDDVAAEFPRLVDNARAVFDYVLVDAPPLAASGEALQVMYAVDTVVLVVRPRSTRVADLDAALSMLDRAGRPADGLLLVGGRGPSPPREPAGPGRPAEGASATAPVTRTVET
jgi:Mrp family chromosome partitioning ATPase